MGETSDLPIRTKEPLKDALGHLENQGTGTADGDAKPRKKKKKTKNRKKVASEEVPERFTQRYGKNFSAVTPWVRLCRDLGVEVELNSKTQCKKVSQLSHLLEAKVSRSQHAHKHARKHARTRAHTHKTPLTRPKRAHQILEKTFINILDFLDAVDRREEDAKRHREPSARAAALEAPVEVRHFEDEMALSAYTLGSNRVYPRREIKKKEDHPLKLLMKRILYPRGGKRAKGKMKKGSGKT